MKKWVVSYAFILIVLLSACSANSGTTNQETPTLVNAEIMIPGKISINKNSELTVMLTQGSEYVDDADQVQFEIWKGVNKEESHHIEAEHTKEGKYSIKNTFKEEGLYYVQTHVTARGFHVMPTKPFIVGMATEDELEILEKELQDQDSQDQDTPATNSGSHHH